MHWSVGIKITTVLLWPVPRLDSDLRAGTLSKFVVLEYVHLRIAVLIWKSSFNAFIGPHSEVLTDKKDPYHGCPKPSIRYREKYPYDGHSSIHNTLINSLQVAVVFLRNPDAFLRTLYITFLCSGNADLFIR